LRCSAVDLRPLFRLGTLSYAIYLLHPFFQGPSQPLTAALAKTLPYTTAVVLAAALITTALLGTAAAANAWIERPGRALLRRIEPRQSTAPALSRNY
jgi:peptidoglycan/LPS O-acetylase OafA/YrhL